MGLEALVHEIRRRDIRSIAVPPLGSGLGGLDWAKCGGGSRRALRILFDDFMSSSTSPLRTRSTAERPTGRVPKMTPGRASLVVLVPLPGRVAGSVRDPARSAQADVLHAGSGRTVSGSATTRGPTDRTPRTSATCCARSKGTSCPATCDRGDIPNKRLTLVPGAVKDAEAFLERRCRDPRAVRSRCRPRRRLRDAVRARAAVDRPLGRQPERMPPRVDEAVALDLRLERSQAAVLDAADRARVRRACRRGGRSGQGLE